MTVAIKATFYGFYCWKNFTTIIAVSILLLGCAKEEADKANRVDITKFAPTTGSAVLSAELIEKETLYAAEVYELLNITPREDHRFA